MRRFAIFAMLVAIGPWAAAQRGGGVGAHAGSHGGPESTHIGAGHGASFVRGGFGRSRFDRRGEGVPYNYLSLPFPFFDDADDSGDIYSTGYPVAAPLPPYLPLMAAAFRNYSDSMGPEINSQTAQSSQPLMIELQNGRYVQVSSSAIDGEALPIANANDSSPIVSSPHFSENPANGANTLAPVVLIFKDGHTERVRDYTIANGVLYARGDYYTDGYWNKQIDLASLNLPETLQVNAGRNVNFVLPSSPNEVIARF